MSSYFIADISHFSLVQNYNFIAYICHIGCIYACFFCIGEDAGCIVVKVTTNKYS